MNYYSINRAGVYWRKLYYFVTARKRSLGQGYIFTPVCHSVHRGGLPQCMLGYHTPLGPCTPRDHAPPFAGPCTHPSQDHAPQLWCTPPGPPLPGTMHTPTGPCTPQRRACWEILSTCRRYASYWNAILLTYNCETPPPSNDLVLYPVQRIRYAVRRTFRSALLISLKIINDEFYLFFGFRSTLFSISRVSI